MVDVAVALPEPRPEDDEDVVWGLSTASALWARGERRDAIVWLRRAADAAVSAGQDFRGSEIGMYATELEDSLGAMGPEHVIPPPPAVGVAPIADDGATIPFEEDRPSLIEVEVEEVPPPPPRPPPAKPPPPPPGKLPPPPMLTGKAPSQIPPPPKAPSALPAPKIPSQRPLSGFKPSSQVPPPAKPLSFAPMSAPRPASVAPPAKLGPPTPTPPAPGRPVTVPPPPGVAGRPASRFPPSASTHAGGRMPSQIPPPAVPRIAVPPPPPSAPVYAALPPPAAPPMPSAAAHAALPPAAAPPMHAVHAAPPAHAPPASAAHAAPPSHAHPAPPSAPHAAPAAGHEAPASMQAAHAPAQPAPAPAQAQSGKRTTPVPATGRRKPGLRSPILDPWSDEPTLPATAADPALREAIARAQALSANSDEVIVARRNRPTPSRDSDDDEVVTSAASLETTLSRKITPSPSRKNTAPGDGAAPKPGALPPATTPSDTGKPPETVRVQARPPISEGRSSPPSAMPGTIAAPSPRVPPVPRPPIANGPPPTPTLPSGAAAAALMEMPIPEGDLRELPTMPSAPSVLRRPSVPPPAAPTVAAPPVAAPTVAAPVASTPIPAVVPAAPPEIAPPPAETAEPTPPVAARAPAPSSPRLGPIGLDQVDAFVDLPTGIQAHLARLARIEQLDGDEEVSGFGAALLLDGQASVCATIVDAPACRATAGSLVPTRGTLGELVTLRVVAGADGATVAVWEQSVVEDALKSCPWVLEELTARADRLQALAGATMGHLGELDEATRNELLDKLAVRVLHAQESAVEKGALPLGVMLVGVGSLEMLGDDATTASSVRPGELLFSSHVLDGSAAPSAVRAGAGGAVLLVGEQRVAQQLMMTTPALAPLLAGD